MAAKKSKPAARKPRADAQRNREHILDIAKDAFTRSGGAVNMDEIARDAGVGPGTLYRHFPTREALIEAVYRSEVAKMAAAQVKFSETMPPIEALRAWMLLFIDYVAAKQIIAPALNTLVGGPSKVFEATGHLVKGAIEALVRRAIESGDLREDVEPLDLLRALVGVSMAPTGPDWKQSAKRLVGILVAGSRPEHRS